MQWESSEFTLSYAPTNQLTHTRVLLAIFGKHQSTRSLEIISMTPVSVSRALIREHVRDRANTHTHAHSHASDAHLKRENMPRVMKHERIQKHKSLSKDKHHVVHTPTPNTTHRRLASGVFPFEFYFVSQFRMNRVCVCAQVYTHELCPVRGKTSFNSSNFPPPTRQRVRCDYFLN